LHALRQERGVVVFKVRGGWGKDGGGKEEEEMEEEGGEEEATVEGA
jgi:hypothetical protein